MAFFAPGPLEFTNPRFHEILCLQFRCDASWNSENCRTPEEWAEANKNSDWKSNNNTVGSSLEYWK